MTYAVLSLCFLVVAAVIAALTFLWTRRSAAERLDASALAASAIGLFVLTAVFDNVMIALELFHYAPSHLLGIHVGRAPIEDFAYPLAGALLLPSIWVLLRARRSRSAVDGRTRIDETSGS